MAKTLSRTRILASVCKESFWQFCCAFWEEVPGAGKMIPNWHMSYLAQILNDTALRVFAREKKEHDVLFNVSPGTSKSTISSILFPCWIWTRMPEARILTASHTDELVLDLANKSRTVIKSELYQSCFPYVQLSTSQDAKGYFINTKGGDRKTCTIAGKSPMGFHADFIICFPWETEIFTSQGLIPIGKIVEERLPLKILAFDHQTNTCRYQNINRYETNLGAPLLNIKFNDGSKLSLTEEHPVFVVGKGYTPAKCLQLGDIVLREVINLGIGVDNKIITSVERSNLIPSKVYNLAIAQDHNYFAEGTLVHNCDDPLDPKKAISEAELKVASYFYDAVLPGRKVNKEVTVEFTIQQRVNVADPSGHILERAKKPDTAKIFHVCLPAELLKGDDGEYITANVHPPELAANYVDGLMDPHRLPHSVLKRERATMGLASYSAQFLQAPQPLGGGMFREKFFNSRCKAAPYKAKRVRFWDRAGTANKKSANTSGTLMAKDAEGNFYVENIVVGQWLPDERDEIILATAYRDRTRYGPKNDPDIYIEQEPGSAGIDSFRHIARKLAGFRVYADRPTGKKEIRAEPLAGQFAAGNVFLVEDNTWDIGAFIEECLAFPNGHWKDRVDSTSGAFNRLVNVKQCGTLHILKIGDKSKKPTLRLVVCSQQELQYLNIEQLTLLTLFNDYPHGEIITTDTQLLPPLPVHGLANLRGSHQLTFEDLDPAHLMSVWNEKHPVFQKPYSELVISKTQGKSIWNFLLRKRDVLPGVWVFADRGQDDGRALSTVLAICDCLRLPRQACIYKASDEDWRARPEDKPPNQFVYDVVKTTRELTMW